MAAPLDVTIRAGERSDADGITDVQVASWRAGYAHVFPDSVLYGDDFDGSRRRFWNAWRFAPGHRIAVATAVSDGAERVIGFASYGPERERARGFTGRGELWAFYLHPDAWGSGAAGALLDHDASTSARGRLRRRRAVGPRRQPASRAASTSATDGRRAG